jgi:hypothetical protein
VDRPDAELSAALEDALSIRVASLSSSALALAECVSLQREQSTFELCKLLVPELDDRQVLALLDELARNDVLYADRDGYRFSSTALREVLLAGMDDARLEQNHKRLGEAFAKLAGDQQPALRIEAGWHLIQGGDELRGADMIASVTIDSVTIRELLANMYRAGRPIEVALHVYAKYRRSVYERLPLLAALAQAGFYEERIWGERYGDQALDLLEDISGVRVARALRPYFGRRLGLYLGLLVAVIRFQLVPRAERKYPFSTVIVQLVGVVTTLCGAAALAIDSERVRHIAEVLEPLTALPSSMSVGGVYEYCKALGEAGRDNHAVAYERIETLVQRFEDPRNYPSMPDDARMLFVAGARFAGAAHTIFQAHGRAALDSADALDRTGLKLYAMIASQLRYLYYANRGEFTKAAPHREQLELHAAHVGSVWQVEIWEAPALMLIHGELSDIVASTRIAHRIETLARSIPSLKPHARVAKRVLAYTRHDPKYTAAAWAEYCSQVPRSFVGWASGASFLANAYNRLGQHSEAKLVCENTLKHLTDADLEYPLFYLGVDIQMAIAESGLGEFTAGLERIDRLLQYFADCDHPLVHGLLHEARARISFAAGRFEEYERGLTEVERWFLPTGTPALVAKCKRLAELDLELIGDGTPLSRDRNTREPAMRSRETHAPFDATLDTMSTVTFTELAG